MNKTAAFSTMQPMAVLQPVFRLLRAWFACLACAALLPLFPQIALANERGSAEEAVAMVKKAVAYLKANGKDKAFYDFQNPNGAFRNKDLYVFVVNTSGVTVANGVNPRLVGKNTLELKDADGKYFAKAMIENAKTNGIGWNDYKWPNPVSNAIESKSAYFERVDDLIIACGIYKQ